MSFLKKLLGKKSPPPAVSAPSAQAPQPVAPPPANDPAANPDLMRVFDRDGRERFIPRQEWRDNVLLGHLEKVWNDPEHLHATIVKSLNDGFLTDMVEPAEQLLRIDPVPERAAVTLSVVYRELGRLADSEGVLRKQVEQHGETGTVLVNLARIHAARGETDQSQSTLWRAIELDANHDEGLAWYVSLQREQGGDAAGLEALRRVAGLPGSWRARLGLAHEALGRHELAEATALYREAIAAAGSPPPADLLVKLSGDLGAAGYLTEMLELAAPLYDVAVHGFPPAHNFLKACVVLGEFDAAGALLDLLYAQQQPDWRPHLARWEAELAHARLARVEPKPDAPRSVALLVDDGPVWLPAGSAAGELFPITGGSPLALAFLGSTAEAQGPADQGTHRVSDAPGRFSRALPLFLAEQVRFAGGARVRPIVPWIQGEIPAFLLGRQPWTAAEAVQHARAIEPACGYIVVTHLQAAADPWRVELRLVRVSDATVLGTSSAEFSIKDPEAALRGLTAELLALLRREAGWVEVAPTAAYRVPTGAVFGLYLLRLEQLQAIRCNTMEGVPVHCLHGERDVLDGMLHLCLLQPDNVVPRLLYVQALRQLLSRRPQVVAEYRERTLLLQQEKPLASPAQELVGRLVAELFP